MKNNSNIDIRRNYVLVLKCLEELIEASSLSESKESEMMFKKSILLVRAGVLKIEHKKSKNSN